MPVTETFSAGAFAELAHREVDEALEAGRRPLVVGGTGLYLQAALTDLELRPPAPADVRERLEAELAERGSAALHAELAARDAEAAAAIEPGDRTRVVRALELLEMGEEPAPTGRRLAAVDRRHAPSHAPVRPRHGARGAVRPHRRARGRDRGRRRGGGGAPRGRGRERPRTARAALGFEELLPGTWTR